MKDNYKAYKALDKKIDLLYEEEKYKEAVQLLEKSYSQFPEYDFELKVYALYCCRNDKNYQMCLQLLNEGLAIGYFYGLQWEGWDPMRDMPGWNEIIKLNDENRAVAEKTSKMEYKVYKPNDYDSEKMYPMFIVLHGDGNACNIKDFSMEWKPEPIVNKGFIVAYVQSSHPECTGGFGWTYNYEKSRTEIGEAYSSICEEYSIDKNQVLLGGFSGGSMASLNVMMNNTFPLKGIVALCPNETDDTNDENMKEAAERGMKLVLLEGEKSGEVAYHHQLMKSAEKSNLPAKYVINKGAGHNVPDNFDQILIDAVDFLLE